MWNSSETKDKIEAIRAGFDGGVSDEHDKKVESRGGAGWIMKTADRIQNEMEWETMVEVARVLQDDATTTEAD